MTGFFSPVVRRFEAPGLSLTLLQQNERKELPRHGHAHAYFSFLLSGSYRERLGTRELDQSAPSVVFHPSEMEHVDAYGAGGGQMLVVEVEPSWLDTWDVPARDRSAPRELGGSGVYRGAWGLYVELSAPQTPVTLTVESLVADLVSELLSRKPTAERCAPAWLHRVVERLRADYAQPPSMLALALESGVHPAHLSRTFRRHLGCSPTTFIQRQRVRHVWQRLTARGAPSLADAALEAGFSDQSHCTRVFRRFVGTPPGVLRSRIGATRMPPDAPR